MKNMLGMKNLTIRPIVKLSNRDIEKHIKLLDKMIKYLGEQIKRA